MRLSNRILLLAGMASGLLSLSSCGDGERAATAPGSGQPDVRAILQKLPPPTGEMPAAWPALVSLMGSFPSLTMEQSQPEALWKFWKETGLELRKQGLLELIADHGFNYEEFNSNGVPGELTTKAMTYATIKEKLERAVLLHAGLPEAEIPAMLQGRCFRAAWMAVITR